MMISTFLLSGQYSGVIVVDWGLLHRAMIVVCGEERMIRLPIHSS